MRKMSFVFALCFSCSAWAGSWSSPVDLYSPPASYVAEGVLPQIEVDGAGNAFAAWCSTDGGNTVWAARYDALTQTWGAAQQIGIANAENAVLSVTTDGKAIVVWDRDSAIYYNSYVSGWRGEGVVDTLSGPSQIHARVGVNDTTDAFAVWTAPAGPTGSVIRGGVYSFTTDSWSNSDIIDTSPNTFVGQPEIAVSATGSNKAVAVWRYCDEVSNDFRIQYSVYTSAWSPAASIVSDSGITANQLMIPIVAISNDGSTAIANWMQTNHATPFIDYYVMGSVYSSGSWSAPIQLSPNQSHLTISGSLGAEKGLPFYSVAFDGDGDAVNLWNFIDESLITPEYIIQARTYQSSIWSSSQDISNTNDFLPQIALDGSGNGWAVWNEGGAFSPPADVIATPFTKVGNTWGSSETISTLTASLLPNVAANAAGNFFADWVAFDTSLIVQAATLALAPPFPPSDFVGTIKKNKFLNKTECILQATWSPSTSSDIVLYRIYLGEEVVAVILATSPLVFEACTCSGEGYEITAVSSDDLESSRIQLEIIYE